MSKPFGDVVTHYLSRIRKLQFHDSRGEKRNKYGPRFFEVWQLASIHPWAIRIYFFPWEMFYHDIRKLNWKVSAKWLIFYRVASILTKPIRVESRFFPNPLLRQQQQSCFLMKKIWCCCSEAMSVLSCLTWMFDLQIFLEYIAGLFCPLHNYLGYLSSSYISSIIGIRWQKKGKWREILLNIALLVQRSTSYFIIQTL